MLGGVDGVSDLFSGQGAHEGRDTDSCERCSGELDR